jgi:hypothetical protein
MPLKEVAGLPHTFDPGRTPTALRLFEREPDWRLPPLVARYPRLSTDRDVADERHLEWVIPGHSLFEALRRHALKQAQPNWAAGACFYRSTRMSPAGSISTARASSMAWAIPFTSGSSRSKSMPMARRDCASLRSSAT